MSIPDNYDLWKLYDAEQCKLSDPLPVCDFCNNEIQDDHYYDICDEIVCEECLDRYFKKEVYSD